VYDAANDTVAATRPRLLHCPSDIAVEGPSYAGCHNDVESAIDANDHGVLYLNSRVRYDEITDGTAQTILLGEIVRGPTLGWMSGTRSTLRNTGEGIGNRDVVGPSSPVMRTFTSRNPRDVLFDTVEGLAQDGIWPVDRTGGFASLHPALSNFLFCDGSVRAVHRTIDRRVYRCLGNRADQEPIDGSAF
jgi:prepilin-type processing-associated H-X9-DG protein